MEHLLIKLITWLFESLFGSQEKPADVGPRDHGDGRRRGPYDYGDGSRTPTSGKSLAELLEEVRQQNAGGGGARPIVATPPPPPPPPQVSYDPEPIRPHMKDTITTIHMRGLSQPAPVAEPVPADQPKPSKKKKKRAAQNQQEHPQHLANQPSRTMMPKAHPVAFSSRSSGLTTGANPAAILWLESIKSGTPEYKKLAQTQALLAMEVFGPPRCRRPYSPKH